MKTIIEMAREAGFVEYELEDYTQSGYDIRYERFAALVRADEREACAKVCEGRIGGAVQDNQWWLGFRAAMRQCAEVIRARGNT
jgi:hypothetical protein